MKLIKTTLFSLSIITSSLLANSTDITSYLNQKLHTDKIICEENKEEYLCSVNDIIKENKKNRTNIEKVIFIFDKSIDHIKNKKVNNKVQKKEKQLELFSTLKEIKLLNFHLLKKDNRTTTKDINIDNIIINNNFKYLPNGLDGDLTVKIENIKNNIDINIEQKILIKSFFDIAIMEKMELLETIPNIGKDIKTHDDIIKEIVKINNEKNTFKLTETTLKNQFKQLKMLEEYMNLKSESILDILNFNQNKIDLNFKISNKMFNNNSNFQQEINLLIDEHDFLTFILNGNLINLQNFSTNKQELMQNPNSLNAMINFYKLSFNFNNVNFVKKHKELLNKNKDYFTLNLLNIKENKSIYENIEQELSEFEKNLIKQSLQKMEDFDKDTKITFQVENISNMTIKDMFQKFIILMMANIQSKSNENDQLFEQLIQKTIDENFKLTIF